MSSVASVTPASGVARGAAVLQVSPASAAVNRASAVSAAASVRPSTNIPAASSPPPNLPSGLPLSVLLSVNRPASQDIQASSDYDTMQNALRSNNLTAAQQAYLRLQNDLVLAQSAPAALPPAGSLDTTA